jgi:hypothetical protein
MLLRVQYSCGVVLVFWFWREIVFDVTYVLMVQYICAVVSFFWLWREIVLKMRTRFNKKILLGYFIEIQNQCEYTRSNTLLHCNYLFCIFSCTAQICKLKFKSEYYLRINMKSCQKCKHQQSHFDFPENAYPISLLLRNSRSICT